MRAELPDNTVPHMNTSKRLVCGVAAAATIATLTAAPANAASEYAAISYSSGTGAYGTAWATTDMGTAKKLAFNYCVQYGGTNCADAAWIGDGCVALAVAADGRWHGGIGPTLDAAVGNAINSNNGGDIRATECSNH